MTAPAKPQRRVLSGVQPTGKLHLGNYFGAVKQHIELQKQFECFYFIADYHSMTTVTEGGQRRQLVRDVAIDYLALGLDPGKTVFFRQSDVPEVCELAWMFGCVTNMGLLERAVSYKDKVDKGIVPSVGLFTYPVLQAADILIYRSSVVPVGEDQVQHVEITRDIAERFNRNYGDIFPVPEHRLDVGAKVPGVDGQKMSKSYNNTIEIFADGNALKKPVMRIVTDSKREEDPKEPDGNTVFALYKLFANRQEQEELAAKFRAGGFGYGAAKTMLLEKIEAYFAPFRERRKELAADPKKVEDILAEGGRRAREEARKTMDLVRAATGFGKTL